MKLLRPFLKLLTLSAMVLALPVSLFSAQINFYVGDVTMLKGSKKTSVTVGVEVDSGDEIITGKDSTIDIIYKDGSKITVLSSSRIRVGSKSIKGSDDIALISGDLSGTFAKLKKGYRKAYTPTMVCSVRGTQFTLGVSGSGDSRVDLSEGKLNISNPYGDTDMSENQKVEGMVGSSPAEGGKGSIDEWKQSRQKDFEAAPEKKASRYSNYMDRFSRKGKSAEKNISSYDKKVQKARNKKDFNRNAREIEEAEESARDDLMLNETANEAVTSIIKNFENDREDLYNQFQKIKEESNRVLEQQQKNYEAIAAVREAHRKAYEKIIGDFKEGREKIFKDLRKKPEAE